MMRLNLISISGLAATVALIAGCMPKTITYNPVGGAAPAPAKTVALQVLDERPADQGGSDKKVVGQVRGNYGIPSALVDSNPNVVVDTVSQATADALAQSGVGVGADGPTLTGTVKHYWLDGFTGYKGTITVAYVLADASGKSVWSKELSGSSGGARDLLDALAVAHVGQRGLVADPVQQLLEAGALRRELAL